MRGKSMSTVRRVSFGVKKPISPHLDQCISEIGLNKDHQNLHGNTFRDYPLRVLTASHTRAPSSGQEIYNCQQAERSMK